MKTSGIYSAFTFSIFLHVLIVAATFVIARHSSLYKIPQAYIVTIVDNSDSDRSIAPMGNIQDIPEAKTQPPKTDEPKASAKQKEMKTKHDDINVRERIEALQAKKRIEKMAALRKMVDIGGMKSEIRSQKPEAQTKGSKAGNQNYGGDYYSMVINKIRQQWIFPESIDKDLLAIITIKIARDGSVTIDRMEQSSGNALFDRSALRAISKANPLPPPPQEMEMGVRFRP
jgi:TonB family protein